MRDCDDQHTSERCHIDSALLPSRVLNLQSSIPNRVCFYHTKNETGRYAALSHVWGEATNPFTMSSANPEEEEGIDIERLPKTFQDTILVARKLGLQYLWIDALW